MNNDLNADLGRGEDKLAAVLKPFGWTCTDEFWRRYYTDSWVFNLANACEALADEVSRLRAQIDGHAAHAGPFATGGNFAHFDRPGAE